MAKVLRSAAGKLQKAPARAPEGFKGRLLGYCLTLLSEATRKSLAKRPADGQSIGHGLALGSPKAAKGAGKGPGRV